MNTSASTSTPAGWFADPWHDYTYRYWDGDRWTGLVSAHEWQPRPVNVSGTWWDATKAVWGFAGYGVDLKSRDLSFTATRFKSAVPYRERAQAAQAHRSMWPARRVLKSGVLGLGSTCTHARRPHPSGCQGLARPHCLLKPRSHSVFFQAGSIGRRPQ